MKMEKERNTRDREKGEREKCTRLGKGRRRVKGRNTRNRENRREEKYKRQGKGRWRKIQETGKRYQDS